MSTQTIVKNTTISIILATLLLSTGANASGAIAGATEPTQIVQMVSDGVDRALSYTEDLTQTMQQLEQLNTMQINLERLSPRDWLSFIGQVDKLKEIVDFQESITYAAANYEAKFKNKFKDYEAFAALASGETRVKDYELIYKDLNKGTRDTVQASLKQLNLSMKEMQDDDAVMDKLKSFSKSAVGQKAAMEAASQIGLHSINQLKQIQKVMMANTQLQASYIAKKNAKEEMIDAAEATRVPYRPSNYKDIHYEN
jgi:P-type conjugative transfer protein TrbJ